jgi:hypothetical protein
MNYSNVPKSSGEVAADTLVKSAGGVVLSAHGYDDGASGRLLAHIRNGQNASAPIVATLSVTGQYNEVSLRFPDGLNCEAGIFVDIVAGVAPHVFLTYA